jgi:transitional endoplasmic reticulum ATPase
LSLEERLAGLRRALDLSPENHELRLLMAAAQIDAGDVVAGLAEYEVLFDAGVLASETLLAAGRTAIAAGRQDRAQIFAEAASGEVAAQLRKEIDATLGLDGMLQVVRDRGSSDESEPALQLDSRPRVTFADVGGLEDVKTAVRRTIIVPFQQPELYERYGRRAGGGVLLFGPPGCGKTLLARATAGECNLPFSNVRIEEILDPFFGMSERNLHVAFAQARDVAPCVLFVDELDAIAFQRRKFTSNVGRPLVDQFLQEMDAIGSDNDGVLVLAATNAPWDVDEAMKRPGRFDRLIFVPPPDRPARERILRIHVGNRPAGRLDLAGIAERTPLFGGADLGAVVERAVDLVIDRALEDGRERPLETADLEAALARMRPSTLEWLATAKNYVEFANDGGLYDDVKAFLRSPEVRAWKGQIRS